MNGDRGAGVRLVPGLAGGVFGEGTADVDPDGDLVGMEMNLRFPGPWLDRETDLHYNNFGNA